MAGASVVELRKMNWSHSVYSMKIVLWSDVNILISDVSTHDLLSLLGPWGSVKTLGAIFIDESFIIARLLQGIATLKVHSFKKWLHVRFGP